MPEIVVDEKISKKAVKTINKMIEIFEGLGVK